MTDWPDNLKEDILEVRTKIKKAREDITGNILEKRAREMGRSSEELCKEMLMEVDSYLDTLSMNLSSGYYKIESDLEIRAKMTKERMKKIREMVREHRRTVTGGRIEDTAVKALKRAEMEIDDMLKTK